MIEWLPILKKIVFEKGRYPQYTRLDGDRRTCTVLSIHGLETLTFSEDEKLFKTLKEWPELNESDVALLIEKVGAKATLAEYNRI